MALHARKAPCTREPVAHVHFYRGAAAHDEPLVAMTIDDVRDALDATAELPSWLLRQLHTYDCERERVVALIFDRRTVLSDVMRAEPRLRAAR